MSARRKGERYGLRSISGRIVFAVIVALASSARADEGHAPGVRLRLHDGTTVEGRATPTRDTEAISVVVSGTPRIVRSSEVSLASVLAGGTTFIGCNDASCKAVRSVLGRVDAAAAVRAVLHRDYAALEGTLAELRTWGDGSAYWRAVYACGLVVATSEPREEAHDLRVARTLAQAVRDAAGTVPPQGVSRALLVVAGDLHRLGRPKEAIAPFSFWPLSIEEAARECDGVALEMGLRALRASDTPPDAALGATSPAVVTALSKILDRLRAEADGEFDRYFRPAPGTDYAYALEEGGTGKLTLSRSTEVPEGTEYALVLERTPAHAPATRSAVTIVRAPFRVSWRIGDRLVPLAFLPCRVEATWGWQLGEYDFVRFCAEVGGAVTRGTRLVSPAIRFRQTSLRRAGGGAPIVVDTLQTYGPGLLLCDIEVLGREERAMYTPEQR